MKYRRLFATLLLLCGCAIDLYGQQDSSAMHLSVDDVVITARRSIVSVPDTRGNVSINMEALKGVPRLGGAVDVIRLLQYTPGVATTQEGNTSLYVRGGDARGFYSSNGFTVLKGSVIAKSSVPSLKWSDKRNSLVSEYTAIEGDKLVMTSDKTFTSPSTAADFCIGSSNIGWLVWKDKDGNTLDSVYRKQLE